RQRVVQDQLVGEDGVVGSNFHTVGPLDAGAQLELGDKVLVIARADKERAAVLKGRNVPGCRWEKVLFVVALDEAVIESDCGTEANCNHGTGLVAEHRVRLLQRTVREGVLAARHALRWGDRELVGRDSCSFVLLYTEQTQLYCVGVGFLRVYLEL